MSTRKIVITGGPGTGKTSIITELKKQNYFCFDEIIRSLTLEAKNEVDISSQVSNPIAFVNDPMDFNTKLLEGRMNQFILANDIDEKISFFDRGIPDVLAYMDFFKQDYDDKFINACSNNKYNYVFLLPPWKDIYKSDNERFETFEEATKIYDCLKLIYKKFEYEIIEIPFDSIKIRANFILNIVEST